MVKDLHDDESRHEEAQGVDDPGCGHRHVVTSFLRLCGCHGWCGFVRSRWLGAIRCEGLDLIWSCDLLINSHGTDLLARKQPAPVPVASIVTRVSRPAGASDKASRGVP